ncbi:sensor histidine kinase [Paenibacillus xanthanilyticus]|uniref:histidine kinase n=1 Tax=Paenibacillus xanthanilyticus TaxID=1783531 RepID=A0ABV8K1L1_9BACL
MLLQPIRRRYLDMPIRRKILLWFIPLLIVTITVTGVFAFRIATREIITKMAAEQQATAKQAIDHLDYIAQDAIDISDYLFLTPEIQSLLRSDARNNAYVSNQTIIDMINRLMVTRPYFQFLTIYSDRFAPLQFNNKGLSSALPFEDYRAIYDYDEVLKRPQIEMWSVEVPGRTKTIFYGDMKKKVLLTKVLKNNVTYEPAGILLLGIDETDIRETYTSGTTSLKIAVINTDGMVLSESTGQTVGTPMSELPYVNDAASGIKELESSIDSSKWVFATMTSKLTGWRVLVVQPRSELLEQMNRIMLVTLLIIAATIIVSLYVSWAVAGVITRPIRRILQSMKKFQKGHFDERVQLAGMDEIGQLGAGYNIMVGRVRELVDDMYAAQLKQKEAELKVLQSQINPHFLYNTLNTIAWTAEKNGDKVVGEMIYALSAIFTISLSQGRDTIALEDEFKLVEHYLFLQQMRFKDRLSYELELDPQAAEFPIPKLLLQPLVENSVVHGIEPLTDDLGYVHVRASAGDHAIQVEITDNGVGIAPDKQRDMLKGLREGGMNPTRSGQSYALYNIGERIRMFYGDGATIDIQSEPGSGTRVCLTLPITFTRR